ncbi:MAG: TfoX/Sxy family protein [Alphaproteobacteria bacterium]|nr:TfoX/Sxy family protein [Alphaproteobacteria bacterium]
MAVSAEFRAHVGDLFQGLGPIDIKLMFGGAGVYFKDQIFALIADERIYLKVSDETRPAFEREGSKPLAFEMNGREAVMTSYVEVPPRLLDDADELTKWARHAYEAAIKGRAKKKPAREQAMPRDLPLVARRRSKKK